MATRTPLLPEHWQAIRAAWEYDPDEPTYNESAGRAAAKHKFTPPGKSAIDERAKKQGWERRCNLNGINAAAQRKADAMTDSDGSRTAPDGGGTASPDASGAKMAQSTREESEDKRAEVTARHRSEWKQVAVLRQESLAVRNTNPDAAMAKAKLAKISAETTALQQAGERKAWGLDILVDPGSVKNMTDEQLDAIINGKVA